MRLLLFICGAVWVWDTASVWSTPPKPREKRYCPHCGSLALQYAQRGSN